MGIMLTTEMLESKLGRVFPTEQATVLAEVFHASYLELAKASDLSELRAVVQQSVEQQVKTAAAVESLTAQQKETSAEVKSLAAQQKETAAEVRSLAAQQKETAAEVRSLAAQGEKTAAAVESLSGEMKLLAEQQKETASAVESLTAQGEKTAAAVESLSGEMKLLAEQQKETSAEVKNLAREHQETRQQLGGLGMTVGYRLEDEAYKALPALLLEDHGLRVEGRLLRAYLKDAMGRYLEVNITGTGSLSDGPVRIVGEAKSQLSKRNIDEFLRKRVQPLQGAYPESLFPVLVTYMISAPDVEEYAREQGVALYYSYQF